MNARLLKSTLPWLALALVMPLLALSFTAGVASAGCGCGGDGTPQPAPPPAVTAVHVDISPGGGGNVEVERQLPNAYPFTRTVVVNENVYLEAIPAEGYYFVGWGGDLEGSESPVYVRVINDTTITAHFFPEEIVSEDNRLRLVFPVGTAVKDGEGQPLAGLEIAVNGASLPSPPEAEIVGLPYELGPQGTTFDQPVTLNFSYDPAEIPPQAAEAELALGYYDEASGLWTELPSVVDTVNHIVSAPAEHLSTFAVIVPNPPPLPASFTASALNVSPTEAEIGETVTVSVLVTNSGELEGDYALILKLNRVVAEVKKITVAGGDSQEVVFSAARDEAGAYSVEVNGLEGSFTVLEAPLLPIRLPKAVIWVILGLAIAALAVATNILPVALMYRSKD
ncbi:MAG: hypothetical protein PVJ08_02990 [Dehalococcoidia bacterium]|jgi:hypothetical protein